jgi:hypothetical protein
MAPGSSSGGSGGGPCLRCGWLSLLRERWTSSRYARNVVRPITEMEIGTTIGSRICARARARKTRAISPGGATRQVSKACAEAGANRRHESASTAREFISDGLRLHGGGLLTPMTRPRGFITGNLPEPTRKWLRNVRAIRGQFAGRRTLDRSSPLRRPYRTFFHGSVEAGLSGILLRASL